MCLSTACMLWLIGVNPSTDAVGRASRARKATTEAAIANPMPGRMPKSRTAMVQEAAIANSFRCSRRSLRHSGSSIREMAA